jgi:hypothetical protein
VMRHTFATTLLDKGNDLKTVHALMGHSHIRTTEAYLHLLEGVGPAIAARGFTFVKGRGFDPRVIGQFSGSKVSRDSIGRLGGLFCELTARGEKHVPLTTQVERIRRFYDPILAKVYKNPEPRRRDLEQLEHIAGATAAAEGS